jgi:hypothetical protein
MDLSLTPKQLELQRITREFVDQHILPYDTPACSHTGLA